jgi:hypothetical protein
VRPDVGGLEEIEQIASTTALIDMNRRRITWLLLLMTTALVFIFSHLLQVHAARSTRTVVGKGVGGAKATARQGESGFDAYFTKANPIPDHPK